MDINQLYNLWLENASADPDLKTELDSVRGKEEEISDRFYRELEFGTGGLRGVIGAYKQNERLHREQGDAGSCRLYKESRRKKRCH